MTQRNIPSSIKLSIESQIQTELKKNTRSQFAAFFDFDGTIIDGDISDGKYGKNGFQGLSELCINKGVIPELKGDLGYVEYKEIREQEAKTTNNYPYMYAPNIFKGISNKEKSNIVSYIKEPIKNIIENNIFYFIKDTLDFCEKNNIAIYIVSASPHIFVQELGQFLNTPRENCFGIDVNNINDFINHAEGKAKRVKYICQKRNLIPILSIGNTWLSDGDMLMHVTKSGGVGILVNDNSSAPIDKSIIPLSIQ